MLRAFLNVLKYLFYRLKNQKIDLRQWLCTTLLALRVTIKMYFIGVTLLSLLSSFDTSLAKHSKFQVP